MSNIIAMLANVRVTDLEAAIPLYQQLAGVETAYRFTWEGLHCAHIPPFLLFDGPIPAPATEQQGTVIVSSVEEVRATIEAAGGAILEGPHEVANGTRLIAKHPDGAVFEYLQRKSR